VSCVISAGLVSHAAPETATVIGGYTPSGANFDALIFGYYSGWEITFRPSITRTSNK
jgi:hypothetical protein